MSQSCGRPDRGRLPQIHEGSTAPGAASALHLSEAMKSVRQGSWRGDRQPSGAPSIATEVWVRPLEGYGSDEPFTDETRTICGRDAALSDLIDLHHVFL